MKLIGHNGREIHFRKTVAHHSHEEGTYNLREVAFIRRVGDNNIVTSWVTGSRRDARSCPLPIKNGTQCDTANTDIDTDMQHKALRAALIVGGISLVAIACPPAAAAISAASVHGPAAFAAGTLMGAGAATVVVGVTDK